MHVGMNYLFLLLVFCVTVIGTFSSETRGNGKYSFDQVYIGTSGFSDHPLLKRLHNYELFQPLQYKDIHQNRRKRDLSTTKESQAGLHSAQTYFTVEFEGNTYVLDVSLNSKLLPHTFHVSSYLDAEEAHVQNPTVFEQNHCYYQGHVKGIADSQVIMSTCNGIKGSIILPNDIIIFEPVPDAGDIQTGKDLHVVYRSSDIIKNKQEGSCGNKDNGLNLTGLLRNIQKTADTAGRSGQRKKRSVSNEKKFVELLLVADNALATRLGLNEDDIVAHMKELANYLDGFYQKLDIRVVLSSVEIWFQANRIALSNDVSQVLEQFTNYRLDRIVNESSSSAWVYADNVQLLFGSDFAGSTIGLASVGTMCSQTSVAVNQDTSLFVLSTAATIAHEMGHNFGLAHDSDGCDCPEGADCIMAAGSGISDVRDWTDCSRGYMEQGERLGLHGCLVNVPPPSRIFGGAECGNEIIEEGEQCDCGTVATCTSACCDPSTCQLRAEALCDEGLCCEDCQFVSAGTECRPIEGNECDLPEFCTGESANCPNNVYLENGTPCLEDAAACSEGVCLTYDLQCQNIWGEEANSSKDICYAVVNGLGNKNGNCGKKGTDFIPCPEEDVMCGKLLCSGGSRNPLIGGQRGSFINTINIPPEPLQCKTIPSDVTATDELDPGLVRAGTLCAPGKVCQLGKCQDLSELTCSSSCNGNGVCNNLGHCHCDDGYAPPDCLEPGNGGSVDSGSYTGEGDNHLPFLVSMSGGLFLIVITVIIYLFGGKDRLNNWKQKRRPDSIFRTQQAIQQGNTPTENNHKQQAPTNLSTVSSSPPISAL